MAAKHHDWQVVSVVGLISLLTSLSGSSLTLAVPHLSRDFNISNSTATWAVTIGLVTCSILLVMFGHIGDLLSKRTVFFAGGAVFVVGSLFAGLAPTFALLLAGRIVQEVGIAMTMANSMGIISNTFPNSSRAEALASVSMFNSVGAISGPAVGGIMISMLSWRWIFLINVPLGAVTLILGWLVLKPQMPEKAAVKDIWGSANWTGQKLFTFGIIAFFAGSALINQPRWKMAAWLFMLLGVIVTVAYFYQDDHANSPWIEPRVLHNADYMISVSTLLIVMLVNAVSNILLPFYLQNFLDIKPFVSGLLMMGQSVTMLLITPIAGYLADHWNRYWLTVIGLLVLIISQAGYALYPATSNTFLILWPIVLNGAGMGLFLSPNNALTMGAVSQKLSGIAGSLNSFFRTLGMTIGMSFGSILLFAQLPGVNRITPKTAGFLGAYSTVFGGTVAVSFIGLFIVLYRIWRVRREKAKTN